MIFNRKQQKVLAFSKISYMTNIEGDPLDRGGAQTRALIDVVY